MASNPGASPKKRPRAREAQAASDWLMPGNRCSGRGSRRSGSGHIIYGHDLFQTQEDGARNPAQLPLRPVFPNPIRWLHCRQPGKDSRHPRISLRGAFSLLLSLNYYYTPPKTGGGSFFVHGSAAVQGRMRHNAISLTPPVGYRDPPTTILPLLSRSMATPMSL